MTIDNNNPPHNDSKIPLLERHSRISRQLVTIPIESTRRPMFSAHTQEFVLAHVLFFSISVPNVLMCLPCIWAMLLWLDVPLEKTLRVQSIRACSGVGASKHHYEQTKGVPSFWTEHTAEKCVHLWLVSFSVLSSRRSIEFAHEQDAHVSDL